MYYHKMSLYKDSGKWNDDDCGNGNSFICQFDRSHNPVTDNGPPEGCDKGWLAFEDQCYLFVNDIYHSQGFDKN